MGAVFSFVNQYALYFFAGLLAVDVVLLVLVIVMRRTQRKIFRGKTLDLEDILVELRHHQDISDAERAEMTKRIADLEGALPLGIRRVGLVRYNPFSDAGGDQSFALALLNEEKNGVVLSSLYGREMNRVYAKLVDGGTSKYQLSEEEKTAIVKAISS